MKKGQLVKCVQGWTKGPKAGQIFEITDISYHDNLRKDLSKYLYLNGEQYTGYLEDRFVLIRKTKLAKAWMAVEG